MLSNIVLHTDTVWRETWIIGESWLHDKTQREFLGFIDQQQGRFAVVESSGWWNEDTEEVEELNTVVSTHETKESAVESMKEYFGVNKVAES